ncbi:PREDICTED: uncharacterized protein LOC109228114 [Nicotiana attenuata]|uniref:uncharacterized protein LOC109228114 n=1 Tax=Nicotiana attenuata TaxID=49451 RepID=UPI0009057862|nr:PREDICTED: uncharacterized protein LOC109228114 [Nicotiana attenuata]
MTNNEVEYEAVIAGLRLALKYGARRIVLCRDSQLVVNQVTWTFQIKEQRLQKYQAEICKLLPEFDECQLDQIPRSQNIKAGGLAKLAATTKSIIGEGNMDGLLPDDKKEPKKLRMQAASLPKEISCDNGPQFTGKNVVEFFEKWHIQRILSTPYHPIGNGQAESSNKSIVNIMKKKLGNAKGL